MINNMIVFVNGLKSDSYGMYLRFKIKNNSNHDFIINRVYFEFYEGKQKLTELTPVVYNSVDLISAGNTEILAYALKKYSLSNKSYVKVHIFESNGNREIVFNISGKELSKY